MLNLLKKECLDTWKIILEKKWVGKSVLGSSIFAANLYNYNKSPIHKDEQSIMNGYKIFAMSALKAFMYAYVSPLSCVVIFFDSLEGDERMLMRHFVPFSIHGNPEDAIKTYSVRIRYGKKEYYIGSDDSREETKN